LSSVEAEVFANDRSGQASTCPAVWLWFKILLQAAPSFCVPSVVKPQCWPNEILDVPFGIVKNATGALDVKCKNVKCKNN
jgi:hypothetical protein